MSQDRPWRGGRPSGPGRRPAPRPARPSRPARAPGRSRSATAARMPFVLLVVTLLAGGLISLLLLNGAVNQDSFELTKLQKETNSYTDEEQALQQSVDEYAAPGSLEKRARELGMVPGGNPAFLNPDGTVRGTADPATEQPAPPPVGKPQTQPPASATPTGRPPATGTPGGPPASQGATTPPPGR